MRSRTLIRFIVRNMSASAWLGLASVVLGIALLPLLAMWRTGWPTPEFDFLLLHNVMEIFAVVVAGVAFITGWHLHDHQRSMPSLVLACSLLSVALLDTMHLLSYQGMPDFISENSGHKAIIFWLGARLAAALGILAYVMLPRQAEASPRMRGQLLGANLAYVALVAWIGLMHPDWVPPTILPGVGLTSLKIGTEALIILLHLFTLALLFRSRANIRQEPGLVHLGFTLMLSILGELFFSVYVNVTDVANGIGHVYKVLAYLFLYQAIFLESVREPFRRLNEAQRQLEESAGRYRELLETAPDAILVMDGSSRIRMVNGRMEELFGYQREELLGLSASMLVPENLREVYRRQWQSCLRSTRQVQRYEFLGQRKDGQAMPIEISLCVSPSGKGREVVAFVRDLSAWRAMENELRHLATHDPLTGLPNRTLFRDRLEQELDLATRQRSGLAVVLLDLDHFKTINDFSGHDLGDQLLVQVARRLAARLRPGDTLARLGGDEFALMLPNPPRPEELGVVASQLLEAMRTPFELEGRQLTIGASVGISLFPDDGRDAEELLARADAAMYQAKSDGRNGYRFYTAELNRRNQESLLLQERLRQALQDGLLELYYQPQVDTRTGQVCGMEALLRWHDPVLGWVSPMHFIPVAESCGLILPLGDWVLVTALRQIRAWMDAGTPIRVAVNLSARQFQQRDLVERVWTLLAETGVPPQLLELEVTESVLMEDTDQATYVLGELSKLGVRLAVDDFGTGYSSLNYLKLFSLDVLKIDRTFIQDLHVDPSDAVIVKAIISLAHSLGLELVAEGVETQEQLEYLREQGCESYQGYYFSKPVPASQCEVFLSRTGLEPVAASSSG